ncbi:MAG: hypothetical protein CME63_05120 [Halobacteriovoraceae bacterium]|nr:hypothetical protein [Halobacteriovoraceae bacterium]|tara:strand:+ start:48026 stop:49963 length:1938 start_codon:yes stop_codon:yes gene_type:complete
MIFKFKLISSLIIIGYSSLFLFYAQNVLQDAQDRLALFERSFSSSLSFLLSDAINDVLIVRPENFNTERLKRFSFYNPQYSQVRVLDLEGQELIRINNYLSKKQIVVDQELLQNKKDRYYIQDILQSKKEIYVSSLDYNFEKGKAEEGNLTLRIGRRYDQLNRLFFLNISDNYFKRFLKDFNNIDILLKSNHPEYSPGALFPFSDTPFLTKVELEKVSDYLKEMQVTHRPLEFYLKLDFSSYRKRFWWGLLIFFLISLATLIFYVRYLKNKSESLFYSGMYKQFIDESFILSMTDKSGKITYVNENFCKISGFSAEELLGRDHRILNSGMHDKEFFQEMWETLKKGEVFNAEICNRNKSGDYYWVQSFIAPLHDADSKVIGYVSVRYDTTEERNLRSELNEVNKEKKMFNQAIMANIGRMSAGLSHQFSTPISTLNTSIDLMEDELKEKGFWDQDADMAIFIKNMRETVFEMINLTTYIKQLSRLGHTDQLNKNEFANLEDIITHSLELSSKKLTDLGIVILWNRDEFKGRVCGNELLISQVFINLITNTLYELRAYEDRWLKIWAKQKGDEVYVYFQDSGRTPDHEICEQMFTPYFSTKDLSQGTGLGLSLCKEILHKYDGDIDIIEKEPNTTFCLKFKFYSLN